jgi:hypothetical protein
MTPAERTAAEIKRGQERSALAERQDRLLRLQAGSKIVLKFDTDGCRRQAWLHAKYLESPGTPVLLAEEFESKDYPTDVFLAKVALGLGALADYNDVPEAVRTTREQELANHLTRHREEYVKPFIANRRKFWDE